MVFDFLLTTILSLLVANLTLLILSIFISSNILSLIFNNHNFYILFNILIYISDYSKNEEYITFYLHII